VTDLNNCTYGMELEFGDIWRDRQLPEGLTWNTKDYSIVSSTGIANDPKGKAYDRGGEINSAPTRGIGEQLAMFEELIAQHPEAAINHRTNLHLHVRVPGLSEDLDVLKKLLRYIDANQGAIYEAIEPIPAPISRDYKSNEAFRGAQKRYKRRKVSHQYKVSVARVEEALQATTVREFFDAHSKLQSNGKRAYGLTTRAGINLLQLQETDTVEFRHFTNTRDIRKLASCFVWVAKFIPMALEGATVEDLTSAYAYEFPEFAPFDFAMECGYQYTNFDKNSRKLAEARIAALRERVDIDTCSALDTLAVVAELEQDQLLNLTSNLAV
jgi:hypothetical protein